MTHLFISHKHSDRTIANVLAQFVTDKGRGDIEVHLSSDARFGGPKFGPGLNEQLRHTLWNIDALLLVYTSDDQDWSYCMLECGLAQHPQSPNTNIIVFQCSDDVPKPFAADLRVDARNLEYIKRFTKQFLTDDEFFPRRGGALAPHIQASTLESDAKELYEKLYEVLPKSADERRVQQWSAWPYLRVEVPIAEIEKIRPADEKERKRLAREVVSQYGVVVEEARAAELFGLTDLAPRHMFKDLLETWRESFPGTDAAWFDSCCEQIVIGAQRQFPIIRRASLRKTRGDADFTPVLSRTRRLPFVGVLQFDIYLYDLSDPTALPVTSRMLEAGEFFAKNLGQFDPAAVGLKDLVGELTRLGRNRLPIVSAEGHPLYMVHRSMIEQFMLNHALYSVGGKSLDNLTLADLLADPKMKEMFETSFAVVSKDATLAETKAAMLKTPNCLDVFVTERGGRDEPVLGWLTNNRTNR